MPRKRTALDEESFAADSASGLYTQKELAERHGVSESLVGKIARGQRRPEVREMVAAARDQACQRIQDRLTKLMDRAVGVLERAMSGKGSHLAIRAASEVLNRTIGRPAPAGRAGQADKSDRKTAGYYGTSAIWDCRQDPRWLNAQGPDDEDDEDDEDDGKGPRDKGPQDDGPQDEGPQDEGPQDEGPRDGHDDDERPARAPSTPLPSTSEAAGEDAGRAYPQAVSTQAGADTEAPAAGAGTDAPPASDVLAQPPGATRRAVVGGRYSRGRDLEWEARRIAQQEEKTRIHNRVLKSMANAAARRT
jgi:transcriptional regulator with XRE-family HTH domain